MSISKVRLFLIIVLIISCSGTREVIYEGEIYKKHPCGLMYKDIIFGKGESFTIDRERAGVIYKGFFEDGTKIFEAEKPVSILGHPEAKRHLEKEVLAKGTYGMKVGGIRKIIIPPDLHIGQTWIPFEIRSENYIVLIVKLIGVSRN